MSSHPLSAFLLLGYVSGESIVINGYVKNFSKVTIRHTKIVLLETIQYLSRGKVIQTEKRELAQIKFAKIRPGSRDEFVNKKLYVPPLPPTNIRNSNIIRLNYDVYVSCEQGKGIYGYQSFLESSILGFGPAFSSGKEVEKCEQEECEASIASSFIGEETNFFFPFCLED